MLSIDPLATAEVQLRVMPQTEGALRIVGVSWMLEGGASPPCRLLRLAGGRGCEAGRAGTGAEGQHARHRTRANTPRS